MSAGSGPVPSSDSPAVMAFFGSRAMADCFDGRAQLQAWLDVEAALAKAQAELGIIPKTAAAAIRRAAKISKLDEAAIAAETVRTAHPIVPLVRALSSAAGDRAGRYVHLGATTQDIMDTGYVLLARSGLDIIEGRLNEAAKLTARLARRHKATVMAGRTHGQHALPTTLGLRLAGWHEEFRRHLERLAQMRPRLLVGSFGGAAGTLAGYGPQALALRKRVMKELALREPVTSWHANQDRFAECLSLFGLIAATAEKLAREVYTLGRTEIGEIREGHQADQVGSSTMPQKRNPIQSEAVIAAAGLVRAQVAAAQGAAVTQDDRDMGAGMAFWKLVPEAFVLTDGLLERLVSVLQTWRIDTGAMARNLDLSGGLILAEAVMLRLADTLGREAAYHAVTEAANRCREEETGFIDCLLNHPRISAVLSRGELEALLDPTEYLGAAADMVDAAVGPAPRRRRKAGKRKAKPKGKRTP